MSTARRGSATALAVACLCGWMLGAMYEAFRKGRLDEFASYTHPALIKQMGGKDKLVNLLRKGLEDMAKEGFRFLSARVGPPIQVVQAGSDLHALVPLSQVMSAPGGELHLSGHLLGVSSNDGQSWTFIDTGKLTPGDIRQLLPTFNPELKLPPRSEPKFVPGK
jgi:hypothetical protein